MNTEKLRLPVVVLQLHGLLPKPTDDDLPYRVRDDFLSKAEWSFYLAPSAAVVDRGIVRPKVRLGDILFAPAARGTAWRWTLQLSQS